jgi:uncharacterized protein
MRGFALSTVVLAAMSNTGPGTHAEEARREITTSGQAVVHVVPDEVLVIAGVDTFHAQLDRAKQDNDALSQRVLKVVEALGVEAGDIKTSSLFVDMEYNVRDDPAKGIEGYHARRSYSILLRDTRRLEALVDAVLKNGANRLEDLQFRTSKLRAHRDEARRMAVRAAKEKAVALAAELGAKVGAPNSIEEDTSEGGWYRYANPSHNAASSAGTPDSGFETLPGGRIEVRAGVKVTFDLAIP